MIKNGEFCVYNGNEYELNEDTDGNLIIITTQIPRSVISRLTPAPSFPWTGRCIFDLQKPL